MRRDFSRTDRVSQQMQKEIAVIIQRDIKDPRVGMATVSSVEVSRDLSFAKVFVTLYNSDNDKSKTAVAVLNEASGFIRTLMGKRIRARIMPQLKFVLDNTLMDGMRISNLVDEVIKKDRKKAEEVGSYEETDEDSLDGTDTDTDTGTDTGTVEDSVAQTEEASDVETNVDDIQQDDQSDEQKD
ncbi:MAG: 30S ribosome-binding factor RbfA [Algicola sp.]|nr:30S ribosome-binding factor RbfA [Algicola sp.]